MEIISEILKWPIIIQGALGSFLFWLFFTVGQKTFSYLNKKLRDEKQLGGYFGREARDSYHEGDYNRSTYNFLTCIYAAIHYFLKFVLSVFIGFLMAGIIPVFGYVGYFFALYFLFRALSYVTHFRKFEKEDEKKVKTY